MDGPHFRRATAYNAPPSGTAMPHAPDGPQIPQGAEQ